MAIGFKKFIFDAEQSADAVIQYLTDPQVRGDYYTEGDQAVLKWLATPRLQRLFALGGPIVNGRTAMRMLFEGKHPVTGEPIRRAGANGTIVGAIDVTLSPAPKSVSVLWALADARTRYEIERMVWNAADFAVYELMGKPLVRQRVGRGADNVRHEVMEDIIGVQTLHTTARLSERGDGIPDPQLHVHSLLFGAVDAAGRLRALDSRQIMLLQHEIDAYASATLAEMLRLHGFTITRTVDERGRVSWELADIPEAVLRIASSRRMEITAEGPGSLREQYRAWCRERYGAEREPVGPAWDEFLAAHRGPKAALQGPALRHAWAEQYEAAGWGADAAREYVRHGSRRAAGGITSSDDNADAIERFRNEFLDDVCREHALVPESHVDAMTFEKAKGLIDVTTALRVVGAMFSDGDLLTAEDGRVTTLGTVAAEQRARKAAQQLMDAAPGAAPSPEAVQRAIEEAARKGLPFDEHQAAAVRLATSGRRFVSITGQAGTGKGVTSGVIAPLWQARGREVIALAVAGRTAQQAGHDARATLAKTIDGFVYAVENGHRVIGPGTVVLIDEAAMIDHTRYATLLQLAADAGATVIQVGDDRQLSPVGPGGLWTLIHAHAAAQGLAAELRVVRRPYEAAEAQAWTDVRAGRVLEALRHWQGRGRLRLYDSRTELQAGMVAEWWADAARGTMVVDTSNAERDAINRMAQAERMGTGELGAESLTLENGCQIRAGDRVLFRAPRELTDRLPRIENGTEATVLSVDPAHDTAELLLHEPRGERTVTLGRDVVLDLAYARHVQLSQGMTVEGAGQVGVSSRTDRERFYVMVSRARAGAVVHTVRSEIAALAAPGLGPVTEAQKAALRRVGMSEVPEDWTWADASVEIDARRGRPLGEWAMEHLTETMRVDRLLAAHLVAQAIARRQEATGEAVELREVAIAVRAAVHADRDETTGLSAWEAFLRDLNARREQQQARHGLARLLVREGRKEAVGDQSVVAEPLRDEARAGRIGRAMAGRDSRPADTDYALMRAWRRQQEQLAELPLPEREPDLVALRFADGVEVRRGQVVRFGSPHWLVGAARSEVRPSDLGVVLGCHRGGITWNYVTVELVGGRRIEVWQTAQGMTVEPHLVPGAVRDAVPRPDQRDPTALNVLELANGARLMAGDRVRFMEATTLAGVGPIEADSTGTVEQVERHRHNRAVVELQDGRTVHVHPLVPMAIVRPAQAHQRERWTQPLAATKPLEQVARWEAMENLPRALALYDVLKQLHISDTPGREVARLWKADPQATIVVQTWEQAAAVRQAIAELTDAQGEESSRAAPILVADPAYYSRLDAQRKSAPGLDPERAYVVADLADAKALARALSVARESHLVTRPPDPSMAQQQALHTAEVAAALNRLKAEMQDRSVARSGTLRERSLELAVEHGREKPQPRHQTDRHEGDAEPRRGD